MRVFVTRHLPGPALDMLESAGYSVDLWPGDMPPPDAELRRRVAAADGLLCLLTDRIDAQLLEAAPRLRVISTMAVGYDHIDVAAAAARGIAVGHTPGVLTETTADLAFALLLASARRLPEAERYLRDGRWRTWSPDLLLGRDVHGATLGIVGFGAIGQAVARRAAGFAMRVLYASTHVAPPDAPAAERVGFDQLLRVSDFVSLHVPLTDATRGMVAEAQLRSMKPTAVLVNTARGGVIDQAALVRALHEGWIAGAGLDVALVEPIPAGDPLLAAPNTVLLPHIGSASVATRERMASMAADNVIAGLRGERLPFGVPPPDARDA